jgi:diguanylate cyclase (GGDEF)-like protein
LYIDVDEFKSINDTLGHDSGDELLRLIAERLQHCVRESDTVSRRGGDEFVALLLDSGDVNAVILCAGKIVETLSAPYKLKDRTVSLSVSVGIALFPEDASEHEEIIRAADIAMYGAKVAGRNGFQRFEASRRVTHESHHE